MATKPFLKSMKFKFLLAALVVGYVRGNPQTFEAVKETFTGGIYIPGVSDAADTVSPLIDGITEIAMKGAAIPVAGPALIAPIVSGTYGIFWGWTQ